eukprot:CAMPEP_0203759770 /NCGR_PEP_ID=MMETSP0098-20131031/12946_1 /ASSEMBLY_ACC=CAM_ASM_000208 /TAXON_ID=96639 /ORGANISM=" , Strain NY0313808BC1" /LENGTH=440 /DNA_ID=CAMNT_0050652945 /DNA_START=419 /DNA_END=1737 /DNA_ORIENTATION=-
MEGKTRHLEEEPDDFPDFDDEEESEDGGNQDAHDDDESDFDEDDSDFDASFAESEDKKPQYKGRENNQGDGEASIQVREVENQPYDAKVDLEGSFSDESVETAETGRSPKIRQASPDRDVGDSPPRTLASPGLGKDNLSEAGEIPGSDIVESKGEERKAHHGVKLEAGDAYMQEAAKRAAEKSAKPTRIGSDEDDDEEDEDDESETSASQSTGRDKPRAGVAKIEGYDPQDFERLDVSNEVKELFQYIGRYKPHDIELDTKLKCFIPDYIPAVGDIDAFIKVPRPDMQGDDLGLKVLDEPAANQSDATVLDLQLRAISKKSVRNPMIVRSIENANNDKKAIQSWIDSIKDLHRSKPPPQVHYTKQMPDIESLMQVWPEEVEQLLRQVTIPSADIDLDLKDYARVVCAMLDIPVFTSMIEPLHVVFTLYSEFRNNQHFRGA